MTAHATMPGVRGPLVALGLLLLLPLGTRAGARRVAWAAWEDQGLTVGGPIVRRATPPVTAPGDDPQTPDDGSLPPDDGSQEEPRVPSRRPGSTRGNPGSEARGRPSAPSASIAEDTGGGEEEPPSIGLYARAPTGSHLSTLRVRAAPGNTASRVDLLVDRRAVVTDVELTEDPEAWTSIPLAEHTGRALHRLEVQATSPGADLRVRDLEVLAEDGAAPEREPAELPSSLDLRDHFPMEVGRVWVYENLRRSGARLVKRVTEETTYRGIPMWRVEVAGTTAYDLYGSPGGFFWHVHSDAGTGLVDMTHVPIPLALAPRVLEGDVHECVTAPGSGGFHWHWVVRIGELRDLEHGGRMVEDVLPVQLTGTYQSPRVDTETDLTLELARGIGPLVEQGTFLSRKVDLRLESSDVVHPDPDPEPPPATDPDPAPEPPVYRFPWEDPAMERRLEKWIADNGLDAWGRQLGPVQGGVIITRQKPDLGGRSRYQWLWEISPYNPRRAGAVRR